MRVPLRRDEDGVIAIVSALLVIVLVGFCAWVTDFGLAYSNKRFTQNGVDAAVLAAGQSVTERVPRNKTCEQVRDDINSGGDAGWTTPPQPAAKVVAENFFRQNMSNPKAVLGSGSIVASCVANPGPTSSSARQLRIDAAAQMPSDAFLGHVFGVSEIPVRTAASAVVGSPTSVLGVYPIAICRARAMEAARSPVQNYAFPLEKADPACGLDNSVWGLLNFDGSRGNGGDDGVKQDLQTGYDKPVNASTPSHPVRIDGSPGFRAALDSLLQDLVGREVTLPVYDEYTSAGKNYRIAGFVTVEVCGFQDKGSGSWNMPCVPVVPHNNDRWLIIRYKNFLPAGELDTDCGFLDPACDEGTGYVVKLGR